MLQINAQRFLQDLYDLAQIGAVPEDEGGGLDRRAFSPAERAARAFFTERAEAAGLIVTTDAAANLSARLSCGQAGAKTILSGSHLDTVPHGGRYDGALGVMAALEALRTLREANAPLAFDLEAIAFTDEEGRLDGLTGSRLMAGALSRAGVMRFLEAAAAYPADLEAMRQMTPGGLAVDSLLAAKRDRRQVAAFVELHIEQGPRLEQAGATIGVVEAIFGRRACQVIFYGRSDHAGTTPLPLRADALAAAARFITALYDSVLRDFPGAVATCGNLTVQPGAANVVPRRAAVTVEFRAAQEATLETLDRQVRALAAEAARAGRVTHEFIAGSRLAPQPLDQGIQAAIQAACADLGLRSMALASGALHDAHSLAPFVPSGMIFVPSKGGRSHTPDEETDADDLVAGANVLLQTLLRLARVVP
ncbi:MAG TPA: Zn-dependent hydrolase [Caldilineaceae bacterium]|nr:Zn-dependent hydrolase [Caldilineaceae bacterium]